MDRYTINDLLEAKTKAQESVRNMLGKYAVAHIDGEKLLLLRQSGDFVEYDLFTIHDIQPFDLRDAENKCREFDDESYAPFPFDELLSGAIGYIDQAIAMIQAKELKDKRSRL